MSNSHCETGTGETGTGETATAYIGLGSNLGDRASLINEAVDRLDQSPGITVTALSAIHETEPVGPVDQPRYLNAACEILTTRQPRDLLAELLTVERALGRDRRSTQRWGPRRIDLDLLLYDDLIVSEPALQVPHPHMHERVFVLIPLAEIAAGVVHPTLRRSIRDLLIDISGAANSNL